MSAFNALGLDGSNPLHALAALGVLRLGDRLNPGLCMGWSAIDGGWRPVYTPVQDAEGWIQEMSEGIRKLAELGKPDPALNREVRELSDKLKKALDERKRKKRILKVQASEEGWPRKGRANRTLAALAPIVAKIDGIQSELRTAEASLQAANGLGIDAWSIVACGDDNAVIVDRNGACIAASSATESPKGDQSDR